MRRSDHEILIQLPSSSRRPRRAFSVFNFQVSLKFPKVHFLYFLAVYLRPFLLLVQSRIFFWANNAIWVVKHLTVLTTSTTVISVRIFPVTRIGDGKGIMMLIKITDGVSKWQCSPPYPSSSAPPLIPTVRYKPGNPMALGEPIYGLGP